MPSRTAIVASSIGLLMLLALPVAAQNPQPPAAPAPDAATPAHPTNPSNQLDCPPGVNPQRAPGVGGGSATTGSGDTLSNKLSESKGIVCPPAATDPGIVELPPSGGALKVVPPPGTPGGDTSVTPK